MRQLANLDETTQKIREDTAQILQNTTETTMIFKGKAIERETDQADADRINQLRLLKRQFDNEIGALKLQEQTDKAFAKKAARERGPQ